MHAILRARTSWRAAAVAVALLLARTAAAATIPVLDVGGAGFVGQAQSGPYGQPVAVNSYAEFTATFGASTAGLANPYLAPSVAAFFANGGQRAWIVRAAGADDAALIGVDGGPGARTGLQALRDAPDVVTVAVPGATSPAVQGAMLALCESDGWRLAVLDAASQTDANVVQAQRAALTSANGFGALYFPWVIGAPAGATLTLPPSGYLAGVFAHTPPPQSPAGATYGTLAAASGLTFAVSSTLQGTLNPLGIDVLRFFSGSGYLVFGARTIASNTDWIYVPVRRTGIALHKSIRQGTEWVVSQPNTEATWAPLREDVGNFLYGRWQAGWFAGVTPGESFFVHCDSTTMNAGDFAANRTVMLVGFAPTRAAEFVWMWLAWERPNLAAVAPAPAGLALRVAGAQPCRGSVRFAYALPTAAAATLRVYDVGGRLVRTLARGEAAAAGAHERAWDGRDERGTPVAPGVYLARLEAAGRVAARRVVVTR